jgi:1,2-diacylglycerol 3-beta-galactosyltransferase
MTEPRLALILTADAGFGHRSAANAIAEAMRELYGQQVTIEIANPMDEAPAILRNSQNDYDRFVRKMPDLYKLEYQFSDSAAPAAVLENALIVLMFQVMRSFVKYYRPDVVISTHPFYMAPLNAYLTLRKVNVPFLTSITDLTDVHRLWFNVAANVTMTPTQEAHQQALESGLPAERLQLTGIAANPAIFHESRSPQEIRAEMNWNMEQTTLLVVGSKRVKNLMDTLNVLNRSGLPFQMVVVAGGDDSLYEQLQATEWHRPTYVYNYVKTLPAFMHAADMIATKAGGLIVTESLASGLPMLLVDVTPGQEEGNANFVVEHGAGDLAQHPLEALEILCHWLENDQHLLAKRAKIACDLGQPRSAFKAAELAWQAIGQGKLEPVGRLQEATQRIKELLQKFDIPVSDQS